MIFKVSEKFKGSCVLPTLNKAIWAKMTISIAGNDLNADDIKGAIRKGILIPMDEEYDALEFQKDHDVIIINNTDRVLVLGGITLRPNGSLPISKDEAAQPVIVSAGENEYITILSDEGEEPYIKRKKSTKKKVSKKTKKEKTPEEPEFVTPESGEDKDPTATTWNFKSKELEEAEKIHKVEEFVKVGEEENGEDIEFVDEKKTTKKKTKKKASVKKKTKKKGKKTKSKKVKEIEPVGEKRLPKTTADAVIELDSRGNPIGEKPGDTLKHLIDSLNSSEDVAMVDDEQALNDYKNRNDME